MPPVIAARLTRESVYIHVSMGWPIKLLINSLPSVHTTRTIWFIKECLIGAVTKVTDHIPTTEELEEKIRFFRTCMKPFCFVEDLLMRVSLLGGDKEHQAELLPSVSVNLTGDSTLNRAEGSLYRVDYVTDQYLCSEG